MGDTHIADTLAGRSAAARTSSASAAFDTRSCAGGAPSSSPNATLSAVQ
ncbi:hypothetical protein [Streptomyces albipurpureus]|uniref:Uncharacterized protein n=1 Tax=Streptomyces albipurpureus TaxID=2897419 RepID=A0ABT0UFR3_9ACTN|nr:hypothetical protein [Streptomyces sp. CWNU-1]MCM2387463.1 hypothetical protein [Streptomyces sp. CWNU-1]